jgi:hypothetical protein
VLQHVIIYSTWEVWDHSHLLWQLFQMSGLTPSVGKSSLVLPCHLTPLHLVSLASLSVPLTKMQCNLAPVFYSLWGPLNHTRLVSGVNHCGGGLWSKERSVNLTSSKFPAFYILQPFGTTYTKRRNVFPILWKSDINFTFAYTRYLKIKVLNAPWSLLLSYSCSTHMPYLRACSSFLSYPTQCVFWGISVCCLSAKFHSLEDGNHPSYEGLAKFGN